jgi:hypothetical protein
MYSAVFNTVFCSFQSMPSIDKNNYIQFFIIFTSMMPSILLPLRYSSTRWMLKIVLYIGKQLTVGKVFCQVPHYGLHKLRHDCQPIHSWSESRQVLFAYSLGFICSTIQQFVPCALGPIMRSYDVIQCVQTWCSSVACLSESCPRREGPGINTLYRANNWRPISSTASRPKCTTFNRPMDTQCMFACWPSAADLRSVNFKMPVYSCVKMHVANVYNMQRACVCLRRLWPSAPWPDRFGMAAFLPQSYSLLQASSRSSESTTPYVVSTVCK